jgi:hypothetical protein
MKGIILAVGLALVATPALAQQATGNGAISGGHYNLNIIGVEKARPDDDQHQPPHHLRRPGTKAAEAVTTRIYLTPARFQGVRRQRIRPRV